MQSPDLVGHWDLIQAGQTTTLNLNNQLMFVAWIARVAGLGWSCMGTWSVEPIRDESWLILTVRAGWPRFCPSPAGDQPVSWPTRIALQILNYAGDVVLCDGSALRRHAEPLHPTQLITSQLGSIENPFPGIPADDPELSLARLTQRRWREYVERSSKRFTEINP